MFKESELLGMAILLCALLIKPYLLGSLVFFPGLIPNFERRENKIRRRSNRPKNFGVSSVGKYLFSCWKSSVAFWSKSFSFLFFLKFPVFMTSVRCEIQRKPVCNLGSAFCISCFLSLISPKTVYSLDILIANYFTRILI